MSNNIKQIAKIIDSNSNLNSKELAKMICISILPPKQKKIVDCLANYENGLTGLEISELTGFQTKNIASHISNINIKLNIISSTGGKIKKYKLV